MNTQELIELAHKSQADAGSLINFNEKVTRYIAAESTTKADPVAAFLGALISASDDTDAAIESFNFYFEELERVKDTLDRHLT